MLWSVRSSSWQCHACVAERGTASSSVHLGTTLHSTLRCLLDLGCQCLEPPPPLLCVKTVSFTFMGDPSTTTSTEEVPPGFGVPVQSDPLLCVEMHSFFLVSDSDTTTSIAAVPRTGSGETMYLDLLHHTGVGSWCCRPSEVRRQGVCVLFC